MSGSDRPTDDPADDRSLDDLLAALASELRATEELPVAPSASVWLGEAHAVAEDLARGDLDRPVVHERVGHVHRLLENADGLDNEAAVERVATARSLAVTVHERTADERPDETG
ncbi:hypothetical protein [Salinigranum marinum]|uniref:hypothetical protein n=1 Tax=Salinigranum marinum TaxID=1515595 RepID=UPI00298A06C5|nr:hypothetical protein [Salinigranum marinum]